MNNYKLTVSSLGYVDHEELVLASSKQQALGTNNRLKAILAWEKLNDIEDCENLPAVRAVLVK